MVVDDNDLESRTRALLVQHRFDGVTQVLSVVIAGDDDADFVRVQSLFASSAGTDLPGFFGPGSTGDRPVLTAMPALAAQYPRYGYRRDKLRPVVTGSIR